MENNRNRNTGGGGRDRKGPFKKSSNDGKTFRRSNDKPFRRSSDEKGGEEPWKKSSKPVLKKRSSENIPEKPEKPSWSDNPRKPRPDKDFKKSRPRVYRDENSTDENPRGNSRNIERKTRNHDGAERGEFRKTRSFEKSITRKRISSTGKDKEETRLNKYIANSGICSRREADVLISTGVVKVNDEVITTMGYKVKPGDKVTVDGREMKSEKKVYILINKPKDTITTTDDPSGRKTVMDIIEGACRERVYPVGRLDRNTTGLLLLTNDGDLSKRLMHPSHKIKKVYEATLDRNITREDMQKIGQGVTIEDDFIPVDGIAWADPDKKNVVGIELHSGKYHVVKRIFEMFNYNVIKLDRTMFGPLTKKNLPRGEWRFLQESEISILHRL